MITYEYFSLKTSEHFLIAIFKFFVCPFLPAYHRPSSFPPRHPTYWHILSFCVVIANHPRVERVRIFVLGGAHSPRPEQRLTLRRRPHSTVELMQNDHVGAQPLHFAHLHHRVVPVAFECRVEEHVGVLARRNARHGVDGLQRVADDALDLVFGLKVAKINGLFIVNAQEDSLL